MKYSNAFIKLIFPLLGFVFIFWNFWHWGIQGLDSAYHIQMSLGENQNAYTWLISIFFKLFSKSPEVPIFLNIFSFISLGLCLWIFTGLKIQTYSRHFSFFIICLCPIFLHFTLISGPVLFSMMLFLWSTYFLYLGVSESSLSKVLVSIALSFITLQFFPDALFLMFISIILIVFSQFTKTTKASLITVLGLIFVLGLQKSGQFLTTLNPIHYQEFDFMNLFSIMALGTYLMLVRTKLTSVENLFFGSSILLTLTSNLFQNPLGSHLKFFLFPIIAIYLVHVTMIVDVEKNIIKKLFPISLLMALIFVNFISFYNGEERTSSQTHTIHEVLKHHSDSEHKLLIVPSILNVQNDPFNFPFYFNGAAISLNQCKPPQTISKFLEENSIKYIFIGKKFASDQTWRKSLKATESSLCLVEGKNYDHRDEIDLLMLKLKSQPLTVISENSFGTIFYLP